MNTIIKTCKKHPKYGAIYKPRTSCESCWSLWFTMKQGKTEEARDELDLIFDSVFANDDYF